MVNERLDLFFNNVHTPNTFLVVMLFLMLAVFTIALYALVRKIIKNYMRYKLCSSIFVEGTLTDYEVVDNPTWILNVFYYAIYTYEIVDKIYKIRDYRFRLKKNLPKKGSKIEVIVFKEFPNEGIINNKYNKYNNFMVTLMVFIFYNIFIFLTCLYVFGKLN